MENSSPVILERPSVVESRHEPNRYLRVLKACLNDPGQVASICPSGSELNERLSSDSCFLNAYTVVEIGPGNGETTKEILARMPANATLLVIEKTAAFIPSLKAIDDPRLIVKHGDALDLVDYLVRGRIKNPDVVVSGVPFSSLQPSTARDLVDSVYNVLPENGKFVAYQVRNHVARYAKPFFGSPDKVQWVWLNLPPVRIYRWTKRSLGASSLSAGSVSTTRY